MFLYSWLYPGLTTVLRHEGLSSKLFIRVCQYYRIICAFVCSIDRSSSSFIQRSQISLTSNASIPIAFPILTNSTCCSSSDMITGSIVSFSSPMTLLLHFSKYCIISIHIVTIIYYTSSYVKVYSSNLTSFRFARCDSSILSLL